jgi:hypothetical protein
MIMRKNKVEDEGIKGMLRDEYNRCLELMDQIKQVMSNYPQGRLVVKKVKSKGHVYEYHHLQWREGNKVLSRHVPEREVPELKKKIEQREAYRSNYLKIEKRLVFLAPLLGEKKPSKRNFRLSANISSRQDKNVPKKNENSNEESSKIKQVHKG